MSKNFLLKVIEDKKINHPLLSWVTIEAYRVYKDTKKTSRKRHQQKFSDYIAGLGDPHATMRDSHTAADT